jgi:hypothetical protein
MSDTITRIGQGVDRLKVQVNGDGNGHRGLTRRLDSCESRQDNVERSLARISNLSWAILTAVAITMVVTMLQKTYGPAQPPPPSQSAVPVKVDQN